MASDWNKFKWLVKQCHFLSTPSCCECIIYWVIVHLSDSGDLNKNQFWNEYEKKIYNLYGCTNDVCCDIARNMSIHQLLSSRRDIIVHIFWWSLCQEFLYSFVCRRVWRELLPNKALDHYSRVPNTHKIQSCVDSCDSCNPTSRAAGQ